MRSFGTFLVVSLYNLLKNSRAVGDLRPHDAIVI